MDIDSNKALAWISIVIIAVSSVVTFSKLFTTVDSHELRIGKIEKEREEAAAAARDRDEAMRDKLGKIQESVNFGNWRMEAVTKSIEQLEKKR